MQEIVESWKGLDRDAFELVDRLEEVADAADLGDRCANGLGALFGLRGHVDGHDVLGSARARLDSEHLFDHLILAEIDLSFSQRREQNAEDPAGGAVVLAKESDRTASQAFVHIPGIGVPDPLCGLDEGDHFGEFAAAGCGRSPTGIPAGRTLDQRRHHARVRSIVELEQYAANHLAQFGCVHRSEQLIDLALLGLEEWIASSTQRVASCSISGHVYPRGGWHKGDRGRRCRAQVACAIAISTPGNRTGNLSGSNTEIGPCAIA